MWHFRALPAPILCGILLSNLMNTLLSLQEFWQNSIHTAVPSLPTPRKTPTTFNLPCTYLSKLSEETWESKQHVCSQRTASHRYCNKPGKAQAVWARKVLSPSETSAGMDSLRAPSRSPTPLRYFTTSHGTSPPQPILGKLTFLFLGIVTSSVVWITLSLPTLFLFHRICWNFSLALSSTSCFYAQTMTTFLFPLMYKPNIFITNVIQSPTLFLHSPFSFSFKE